MKTEQKKAYLAPQIEMLVIELEEGIAAVSPGGEVAPGTSPGSNGWETGGGGSWNGEAS